MTEEPEVTWWSSHPRLTIVIVVVVVIGLCAGGYWLFVLRKTTPDPLAGCGSVTEYLDENPKELSAYLDEKRYEFTDDYIKNYLESDQAIQEEIVQPYIDQYIEENGSDIVTQYVQDHPEEFQR